MKINLKDFRQSVNMYQSDMAELLGLNQSNVSRAELRGFFEPTYPQLQALYERFGEEEVNKFVINDADRVSFSASNPNIKRESGTMRKAHKQRD